jgi:hypothetical protein
MAFDSTGLTGVNWRMRPCGVRAFVLGVAALFSVAADSADASETVSRHSILIFYANETSRAAAQSVNYAKVLAVLHRTGGPLAEQAAASILRDAERFPALVKRDSGDLLAAAQRWKFDLAVFTNEMALQGQYIFYSAETDKVEQETFPEIAATSSVILATSPLARPDVFRSALVAVAGRYPKDSLDAVVMTDTHGSGLMALIPRVNADLSRPDAGREMQALLESDDNGVPPEWAKLQGTSKLMYWQTIRDVSALYGVRFPLAFREACASGLRTWREYMMVPDSVVLIAHSAMAELDSATINYSKIFADFSRDANWQTVLSTGIHADGVHVNSRWTVWLWVALIGVGSIPSVLFFLPLAAWLIWYLVGVAVRRRRNALTSR